MKPKVLIVDDEKLIHGSFLLALRNSDIIEQIDIEFAFSCDEAISMFTSDPFRYSLAFVDYQYEKQGSRVAEGHLLVKKLKELNPCITTVIMSGDDSEDALKDWLDSKVDKFLYKPLSNEVIRGIIENSLEDYNENFLQEHNENQVSLEQKKVGLAGNSINIKNVSKLAMKFAKSKEPSLILGETGTGKELVARAIHDFSSRSNGPFIVVNCAAITKTLFESEVFGHVKGAFTDAKEDKLGKFREADKGTLFLDEIHHLSLDQQASLLRVIQEKQVLPVGGKHHFDVDFKLVVAGKPNLRELTETREFLPDLYFRISSLNLKILPLRERPEDIVPTIKHIQKMIESETGVSKRILKTALQKLSSYNWPGNVRELQGEIKRLNVVVEMSTIRESDLSEQILEQSTFSFYNNDDGNLLTMNELEETQRKQEIALIIKALKQSENKISKASELLGMRRTTLSSKMEQLGIRGKDSSILDVILNSITKDNNGGQNERLNQVTGCSSTNFIN
jgi:two-component system, NtrC family, response regulator HydG